MAQQSNRFPHEGLRSSGKIRRSTTVRRHQSEDHEVRVKQLENEILHMVIPITPFPKTIKLEEEDCTSQYLVDPLNHESSSSTPILLDEDCTSQYMEETLIPQESLYLDIPCVDVPFSDPELKPKRKFRYRKVYRRTKKKNRYKRIAWHAMWDACLPKSGFTVLTTGNWDNCHVHRKFTKHAVAGRYYDQLIRLDHYILVVRKIISLTPEVERQRLQALAGITNDGFESLMQVFTQLRSQCNILIGQTNIGFPLEKIESLALDILSMIQCTTKTHFVTAALACISRLVNGSLVEAISARMEILGNELWNIMSDENQTEQGMFRDLITNWERMSDSMALAKLREFMSFCMTFGTLEFFGLSTPAAELVYGEFKATKKHKSLTSYALAFCDVAEFVFSRMCVCVATGTLAPLMHTADAYGTWYDDCATIVEWNAMLGHDAEVQLQYFNDCTFFEKCCSCVERGEEYSKLAKSIKERRDINAMVSKIRIIKGDFETLKMVGKPRAAPFALMIAGDSAIGKTTVQRILVSSFAKITGLPDDPKHFYTRDASDDFMSGFKSYMWFINMDDVATTKPTMLKGVDNSVSELFRFIQNIPTTANMASLEEKGRVAIRPDFVIATTNVPDMNASSMFSCPSAARRRLPWRITPKVKPQYRTELNENMLDSSKCTHEEGKFPDYWTFKVEEIRPLPLRNASGGLHTEAREILIYENATLAELLAWFQGAVLKHRAGQAKLDERLKGLRDVQFCDHLVPKYLCPECQTTEDVAKILSEDELTAEKLIEAESMSSGSDTDQPVEFCVRFSNKETSKENPTTRKRVLQDYFSGDPPTRLKPKYHKSRIGRHKEQVDCQVEQVDTCVMLAGGTFSLLLLAWCMWEYCVLMMIRWITWFYWNKFWRRPIEFEVISWSNITRDSIMAIGESASRTLRERKHLVVVAGLLVGLSLWRLGYTASKEAEQLKYVAPKPFKEKEKTQWTTDFPITDRCNITRRSMSWKSLSISDVLRKVERNVAFVRFVDPTTKQYWQCDVVFLGGFDMAINSHTLRRMPDVTEATFVFDDKATHIGRSTTIVFDRRNLVQKHYRDVTIVQLQEFGIHPNIKGLLPTGPLTSHYDGIYVHRDAQGCVSHTEVLTIQNKVIQNQNPAEDNAPIREFHVNRGTVKEDTVDGFCGSLLILITPFGPVVGGIHSLGGKGKSVSASVFFPKHLPSENQFEDGECDLGEKFDQECEQADVNDNAYLVEPVELIPELRRKDPLAYRSKGLGEVYGSLSTGPSKFRSRVKDTHVSKYWHDKGHRTNCVKPISSNRVFHKVLDDTMSDNIMLSTSECSFVCGKIAKDFLAAMTEEDKMLIEIYDVETAVNGAVGVGSVDHLDMNTSLGYPVSKPKRTIFTQLPDGRYSIPREVLEEVKRIHHNAARGRRSQPIFKACVKDEARDLEKVIAHSLRVFMGCPTTYAIVMRQHFLSLIRVIQRNPLKFETAIGINAHSDQWDVLANHLLSFGSHFIVGDHRKYDKRMVSVLIYNLFCIAIEVIVACLRDTQRIEEDDMAPLTLKMRTLAIDTAYAYVDFNGTLVSFLKNHVSGHVLTVVINSFGNSAYVRMAYRRLVQDDPELEKFQERVRVVSYGDDLIVVVKDSIAPIFTFRTMKEAMESFGVEITPANKDGEDYDFLPITEIDFLKRKFVLSGELDRWIGPLSKKSISKSLLIAVESQSITPREQSVYAMVSALREMFFHGETEYNEFRTDVFNCCDEYELWHIAKKSMFPGYSNLLQLYKSNSVVNVFSNTCEAEVVIDFYEQTLPLCLAGGNCTQQESESEGYHPLALKLIGFENKTTAANGLQPTMAPIEKGEGGPQPCEVIETFHEQSLVQYADEEEGEKAGLVSFIDPTRHLESIPDEMGLANFLSRPVELLSTTWSESTYISTVFYPWQLWIQQTRILNKVRNYALFRANMKLKVMVNASPFYYGRARLSYIPLLNYMRAPTETVVAADNTHMIPKSQQLGFDFSVDKSEGGELSLPFFYPKTWMDMTKANEFKNMGQACLASYTTLEQANSVTGGAITITVYGWCENVELSGPTETFLAQSGYGKLGPISGPSSAVAKAAKALGQIPMLAPFAKSTEMAANTVGDIAKYFGYTNVPNTSAQSTMKPMSHFGMATTEISTPYEKLAYDDKNELSIDPRIAGLPPTDEMTIESVISRESFLMSASWAGTHVVDSTLISGYVGPNNYRADITTTVKTFYQTPLAHISRLFQNWRGSIVFKFVIVCSQYHRGRLRFVWDPINAAVSTTQATVTTLITKIVDIGETREFEVEIPYMQATSFLPIDGADPLNSTITINAGSPGQIINNALAYNGGWSISVLNPLTSPVLTGTVQILMYVRAGKDFEFANPRNLSENFTFLQPQSAEGVVGIEGTHGVEKVERMPIAPAASVGNLYDVYMGEAMVSLRQMLHRQSYYHTLIPRAAPLSNCVYVHNKWNIPWYPMIQGYQPTGKQGAFNYQTGIIATTVTAPVNYTAQSVFSMIAPLYIGARGSIVYNLNQTGPNLATVSLSRTKDVDWADKSSTAIGFSSPEVIGVDASAYGGYMTYVRKSYLTSGPEGRIMTNGKLQPGLMGHFPYYSPYRFTSATGYQDVTRPADEKTQGVQVVLMTQEPGSGTTTRNTMIDMYMMAGHDFSFLYFNCVPTYYAYTPTLTLNF